MNSWHKRRGIEQPKKEKPKTMARLFVESRRKHNLSMKEDYLKFKDVASAINMNALEQRMITKQRILKKLELGIPRKIIIGMLEEEIHIDRHRLIKYYHVHEG